MESENEKEIKILRMAAKSLVATFLIGSLLVTQVSAARDIDNAFYNATINGDMGFKLNDEVAREELKNIGENYTNIKRFIGEIALYKEALPKQELKVKSYLEKDYSRLSKNELGAVQHDREASMRTKNMTLIKIFEIKEMLARESKEYELRKSKLSPEIKEMYNTTFQDLENRINYMTPEAEHASLTNFEKKMAEKEILTFDENFKKIESLYNKIEGYQKEIQEYQKQSSNMNNTEKLNATKELLQEASKEIEQYKKKFLDEQQAIDTKDKDRYTEFFESYEKEIKYVPIEPVAASTQDKDKKIDKKVIKNDTSKQSKNKKVEEKNKNNITEQQVSNDTLNNEEVKYTPVESLPALDPDKDKKVEEKNKSKLQASYDILRNTAVEVGDSANKLALYETELSEEKRAQVKDAQAQFRNKYGINEFQHQVASKFVQNYEGAKAQASTAKWKTVKYNVLNKIGFSSEKNKNKLTKWTSIRDANNAYMITQNEEKARIKTDIKEKTYNALKKVEKERLRQMQKNQQKKIKEQASKIKAAVKG